MATKQSNLQCFLYSVTPSVDSHFLFKSVRVTKVNRSIAYSDGVRVIEQTKLAPATLSDGLLFTKLDRPDGQPCIEAKEFGLVRNMLIAAVEERYKDAALWRDMLNKLRTKSKKWA